MNSGDLVNIIEALVQKNLNKDVFRLAEVTALSSLGVRLKFDGETTASTKYYPIVGGAAILRVADRVLTVRVKGSYAVIGRVASGAASMYSGFAKVYPGDINGDGVAFGMGGLTIIGGGESAITLIEYLNSQGAGFGTENAYLAADGSVEIATGIQSGGAARKYWNFSSTGLLSRSNYKEGNGFQTVTQRVSPNHQDPMLITDQVGSVSLALNVNQAFADFTFVTAFDIEPQWVSVTGRDSNSANAHFGVYNITSTGFRIYATRINTASGTAMNPGFQVVACGKKL